MRHESGRLQEGSAAPANTQDAPWRQYPNLDASIETEGSPVIANIERTRNELVRTSQSGTAREKERARAVLTAYNRVLELYRRLVSLQDLARRASASNMRAGATIKQ